MEEPSPPTASGSTVLTRLRSNTAVRDGLVVLAAQGVAILIALGMDVLLFRNLPQSERGYLSAALSLRNVLLYIADMGLALTTVRVGAEYFGKGLHAEANAIFRRALMIRLALAALVTVLACALSTGLARIPLAAGNRPMLVIAAAVALIGMTAISWGVDVAQATRRFGLYFAHQVVEAGARAGAVVLLALAAGMGLSGGAQWTLTAENLLLVLAAAAFLAGGFSVMIQRDACRRAQTLEPSSESKIREQLRSFGRVAAAMALLQTFDGQVQVFIIQWKIGAANTAYFDGARRLAMLLPILGGVIATVLLPRAAVMDTPAACAAYVRKSLVAGFAIAAVAAGGLAAAADFIVPLLWGARYAESIEPLRWLCAAHGCSIVLAPLMLVFYPLKREGTLLVLQILALAFSIWNGLWMIPILGARGAAWATLAGRSFLLLLCVLALFVILNKATKRPESQ